MPASSARARADIRLYRQLDSILREQIADGVLRAGTRLPSEEALCSQYGISRGTVRQALDGMARDGLIERAPGRGTFVRARGRQPGRDERTLLDWAEMVDADAARAERLTTRGTAPPPPVVSAALGVDGDAETPFFIRQSAGRPPLIGLKRYLHPRLAGEAERLAAAPDFAAALGGTRIVESWAEAILAEPRFAMRLKVPLGSPLLSLWWAEVDAHGPAACSQLLRPGGAVALRIPIGGADAGL